jgi:four helix bundle protein
MDKPWPITDRTFEFSVQVVKLVRDLSKRDHSARRILDQLLRSATSIGANVEESQAAESKADFIHKYQISLKEARETRYWLRLLDAGEIAERDRLAPMIQESLEIAKIIAAIICKAKT